MPGRLESLARRVSDGGPGKKRREKAPGRSGRKAQAGQLQADGADPGGSEAQDLLAWHRRLIAAFTGGDPGILASLSRMYRSDPGTRKLFGIDTGAMAFLGQAPQAGPHTGNSD